ncbi:MAG: shikimate kinase [bacterium]
MSNIILIGFMGSGKTAVGQALAKELGYAFIDTDEIIETGEKRTIGNIFMTEGEEYFRGLETNALKSLTGIDQTIVSTGGGIILKEENLPLLKGLGKVVYLSASHEVIYDRIKDETHRPLLRVSDPKKEIGDLLAKREEKYKKAADIIIDTSGKEVDVIVRELIKWQRSK